MDALYPGNWWVNWFDEKYTAISSVIVKSILVRMCFIGTSNIKIMKKTLLIGIITLAVSGCSMFLPSLFDPTEHGRLVDIAMISQDVEVCRDRNSAATVAAQLKIQSNWLSAYGNSLPANNNLAEIEKQIYSMSEEMYQRYQSTKTVSVLYCENKLKNINTAAQRGMQVSARRPRI